MLLTLRTTNTHGNARSTADAVITALTPAAWYRNATDVVSSGGFASIWADYASTAQGLVLPGVNGNYASTPDSVALSTVDIDAAIRILCPDWTPVGTQAIYSKLTNSGGNKFSWRLYINAAGTIECQFSTDGTTLGLTATSSASPVVSNGAALWLRVTRDSASGDVKFYTASDASAIPTSWTQLGITRSTAAGAVADTASPLNMGTDGAGTVAAAGTVIYRAVLYSGIGGTTVFDADFSSQAIGAGSFTESSSNAATVTINASGAAPAHIGKARDLLQGTGTNQPAYAAGVFTADGVDNRMVAATWLMTQPVTVYWVGKQVTWTSDYIFDGTANVSGLLYQVTSSPILGIYAGSGSSTPNSDLVVDTRGIVCVKFNGASSSLRVNDNAATAGSLGAGAMGGFTLFSGGGNSNHSNATAEEVVIFAAAHSDAEQDSVITALNNALTVF